MRHAAACRMRGPKGHGGPPRAVRPKAKYNRAAQTDIPRGSTLWRWSPRPGCGRQHGSRWLAGEGCPARSSPRALAASGEHARQGGKVRDSPEQRPDVETVDSLGGGAPVNTAASVGSYGSVGKWRTRVEGKFWRKPAAR
jgi:hypothetical protein